MAVTTQDGKRFQIHFFQPAKCSVIIPFEEFRIQEHPEDSRSVGARNSLTHVSRFGWRLDHQVHLPWAELVVPAKLQDPRSYQADRQRNP